MENFGILVIDDSVDDRVLFQRAFKKTGLKNPLRFVGDADEAIQYMNHTGPYEDKEENPSPGLILVDLKLPGGGGLGFLEWLREHPGYNVIPTIVMSGSSNTEDIKTAYQVGANSYILKRNLSELETMIKSVLLYWSFCEKPCLAEEWA